MAAVSCYKVNLYRITKIDASGRLERSEAGLSLIFSETEYTAFKSYSENNNLTDGQVVRVEKIDPITMKPEESIFLKVTVG